MAASTCVGVILMVVMIVVGGSLSRYDRVYGSGGAKVVFKDPDLEAAYPFAPGEMIHIEETEEFFTSNIGDVVIEDGLRS